jgi:hypothetical protein
VATLPEGFDASKRGAIPAAIHAWACPDGNVPAVKTGAKGSQKSTDYGRGVDALSKAIKALLNADAPKTIRLAVSMSGDDAPVTGTVAVPADHELYAALVEMIRASQAS